MSLVAPLGLATDANDRAVKEGRFRRALTSGCLRVEPEAGRTAVALLGLFVPVVRSRARNAGTVRRLERLFFRTSHIVLNWSTDLARCSFVGLVGSRLGLVALRGGRNLDFLTGFSDVVELFTFLAADAGVV